MRFPLAIRYALLIICFGLNGLFAQEIPEPSGFVNDFQNLLSESEVESLDDFLEQFALETSNEITVVTINLPANYTVESYSYELFNQWGIGGESEDNGVLLAVFPNERKVRIEVGYGLEPVITDIIAKRVIDVHIIPWFKAGNYAGGIIEGTEVLAQIAKGEFDMESLRETYYDDGSNYSGSVSNDDFFWFLFLLFFLIVIISAMSGGGGGGWGNSGGGYYNGGSYSSSSWGSGSSWGSSGGSSWGRGRRLLRRVQRWLFRRRRGDWWMVIFQSERGVPSPISHCLHSYKKSLRKFISLCGISVESLSLG